MVSSIFKQWEVFCSASNDRPAIIWKVIMALTFDVFYGGVSSAVTCPSHSHFWPHLKTWNLTISSTPFCSPTVHFFPKIETNNIFLCVQIHIEYKRFCTLIVCQVCSMIFWAETVFVTFCYSSVNNSTSIEFDIDVYKVWLAYVVGILILFCCQGLNVAPCFKSSRLIYR